MKHLLYIVAVITAFVSCKPGIPSNVLSEGTMVDVLYDMHVAQAMSENPDVMKNREQIIALRSSILEKYGITKAEWDSSFVFYCGHANFMNEVYKELDERLNDEVVALGGKSMGISDAESDSANIWRQEDSFILWDASPYNRVTFSITPDSTFHDGDRLNLQFITQLLFKDGMRDITVSMNVYYDNDSICTRVQHVTQDGGSIISLSNDVDRLKVKKITGFFLLTKDIHAQENTNGRVGDNSLSFRLAAIREVRLLHPHSLPPATDSPKVKQDTINNDRSTDQGPGSENVGPPGDRPVPRPDIIPHP